MVFNTVRWNKELYTSKSTLHGIKYARKNKYVIYILPICLLFIGDNLCNLEIHEITGSHILK